MSQKLLQVNVKFSIPRTDLEDAWLQAAQPIADAPGLRWKVWLMNEAEHASRSSDFGDARADSLVTSAASPSGTPPWLLPPRPAVEEERIVPPAAYRSVTKRARTSRAKAA